jgi:hypothetical protein
MMHANHRDTENEELKIQKGELKMARGRAQTLRRTAGTLQFSIFNSQF